MTDAKFWSEWWLRAADNTPDEEQVIVTRETARTTSRVLGEAMHVSERLRKALETALAYLTNANSVDEAQMVRSILEALREAGTPPDDLDRSAVALLRGAARATKGGAA
jgi:hypothetical protein